MDMVKTKPQFIQRSTSVKRVLRYTALATSLLVVSPIPKHFSETLAAETSATYSISPLLSGAGFDSTGSKFRKMSYNLEWLFDTTSDLGKTRKVIDIYFENIGKNERSVKLLCDVVDELKRKNPTSVSAMDLLNQLAYINGDTLRKELRPIPYSVFYVASKVEPAFAYLAGKEKPAGPEPNFADALKDEPKPAQPETTTVAMAAPVERHAARHAPRHVSVAEPRETVASVPAIVARDTVPSAPASEISERMKETADNTMVAIHKATVQPENKAMGWIKRHVVPSAEHAKDTAARTLESINKAISAAPEKTVHIGKNISGWAKRHARELEYAFSTMLVAVMVTLTGVAVTRFTIDLSRKARERKEERERKEALATRNRLIAMRQARSVVKKANPKAKVSLDAVNLTEAAIRAALEKIKSKKTFRRNKANAARLLNSVRNALLIGYAAKSMELRQFDSRRKEINL